MKRKIRLVSVCGCSCSKCYCTETACFSHPHCLSRKCNAEKLMREILSDLDGFLRNEFTDSKGNVNYKLFAKHFITHYGKYSTKEL